MSSYPYIIMEIITWHISIKNILKDNRILFCKKFGNSIRDFSYETINKVLLCWSQELWFATLKCNDCWETKHVPFTCKSRFCNSCWKPQSDIWFNKLIYRWPKWLNYYHLAFTIPEELRPFFRKHRLALNLLPKVASNAMLYFFQSKHKSIPWILSVIHSFGAKLNWNPHVHLIVTAWWIQCNWKFKHINYIPYKLILPSWKKYLLKNLKERCYKNIENPTNDIKLLNYLYQQKNDLDKEKSRYIRFSKKANSFHIVLNYIWRYLKRPIISQSRILHYDWDSITFSYKDKYDNKTKTITTSSIEFIWLLLQHLPNKFFHMIYYYWIFANRCKTSYLRNINSQLNNPLYINNAPIKFYQRKMLFTWNNPLVCTCWWCFSLCSIFIPWYQTKYFNSS